MIPIVFILQLISLAGATRSGIVGGKEAKPHSRPYMASLQFDKKHSCGGILIREDFVLTTAHCKKSLECLTVVLGAHDLSKEEKSQQRIEVAEYYQHPKYCSYDNDIMLLKLKHKAKLTENVSTIALPNKDKNMRFNIECDVAGWGQTGANKPASTVLRETTETLQWKDECKNQWKDNFNSAHMLCTTNKKRGVCQGDSGGPLICKSKLQGLTSYVNSQDCSKTKLPHVFTKVSAFLPWIKKVMEASGDAI